MSTTDLLRVRAALSVGMPPSEALGAARDAELAHTARMIRLGLSLTDAARAVSAPGELGPGPLLRALAVAERSGHRSLDALDVVLRTRHDALVDRRRIEARSAQAIGTARVLTAVPCVAWLLLVITDPGALRFYRTSVGVGCAIATAVLSVAAHLWSRRLVRRAAVAAAAHDPLTGSAEGFDRRRAAAVAGPVLLVLVVVGHPVAGVAAATVVAAVAGRPRAAAITPVCSSREVIELLRMLLASGTGLAAAVEHIAAVVVAPPQARLDAIAHRLRTGGDIEQAFVAAGLPALGAVVAVTERWGVGASAPLAVLGDAVRAEQRAAAEVAAERVQLALVFPTTLLTLPAFVVAIVPPLVWTALAA